MCLHKRLFDCVVCCWLLVGWCGVNENESTKKAGAGWQSTVKINYNYEIYFTYLPTDLLLVLMFLIFIFFDWF